MSVTDLASYRRDDRARHLALWRAFSGVYVDLCEGGFCDYDPKTLRRLWEDYCADMPAALRARAMMGSWAELAHSAVRPLPIISWCTLSHGLCRTGPSARLRRTC